MSTATLAGLVNTLQDEIERLKEANDRLRQALRTIGYLEVTNLGDEAESGRPRRYYECRLCGDWNDAPKHVEHADGCPLRDDWN